MINLFFMLASAILGVAMFGTILFADERTGSKAVAGLRDAGVDELFGAESAAKRDSVIVAAEQAPPAKPEQRRIAGSVARQKVGPSTLQMAAQISGGSASYSQQMSGCA